jgi:hypothetical protein
MVGGGVKREKREERREKREERREKREERREKREERREKSAGVYTETCVLCELKLNIFVCCTRG